MWVQDCLLPTLNTQFQTFALSPNQRPFGLRFPNQGTHPHRVYALSSTAAPFVPPFIFRRKRSAQNKLFARRRAQIPGAWRLLQNSDTCMQQKIPRSKVQGIFLSIHSENDTITQNKPFRKRDYFSANPLSYLSFSVNHLFF